MKKVILVGATVLATMATDASAEEPSVASAAAPPSGWEFQGSLYAWVPWLKANKVAGGDIKIDPSDIWDTLDFFAFANLEARNGRWSLFGDFVGGKLSENESGTLGPAIIGPGIPESRDLKIKGYAITGAVGYDVLGNENHRLTPIAGFRYLYLDLDAKLSIGPISVRSNPTRKNVDGIVGLRGRSKLNDKWSLSYYADVGTGDSDITWQVAGVFDYQLNEKWTLSAGYRYLKWEFDNAPALDDFSINGPVFGVRFDF